MFTAHVRKDEEGYTLVIPDEEAERLGLQNGDAVTANLTTIPAHIRRSLDEFTKDTCRMMISIPGCASTV
jgi:bifunctional DNA-binding transcriptional regulator/antitoxin component of YhaV-PrlF toxin-antitoxin module